jgi:putative transposase
VNSSAILTAQFAMSLRQACRTVSLSRTVYFYRPDTRRDEPVIHALTELAERYPRYGFKKVPAAAQAGQYLEP